MRDSRGIAPQEAAGPGRTLALRAFLWAAIGLAALLIRLPHLTESLWFDEIWRTHVVLHSENLESVLLHDVHNPLYNSLMYAWTSVAGDSEIAIRLPSLAFGLVAVVVLYRWMTRRFGEAPALLAAALLLLSPVHAWYSCEAKNNMLVVLMGVLMVVQTDQLLSRARWGDAILCTLWSALAFLTSWQAALVVLPAWLAVPMVLIRSERATDEQRLAARRRWMLLGTSVALTFAVLSPLLIFKATRVAELSRWYLGSLDLENLLRLLFIWYPTGNALVRVHDSERFLWMLAFGSVVAPALVLGAILLRRTSQGLLVLACLGLPLGALLATTTVVALIGAEPLHMYQERNTLVVLPWFVATLAVGATRPGWWRACLAGSLIVLSLASSAAAVTWRADMSTVMNPNPDWRGAAKFLRASAGADPQPPILLSCCPLLPLEYYPAPGRRVEVSWQESIFELVNRYRREYPKSQLFLINNPYWFGYPDRALSELEHGLGQPPRTDFRSLQIYRFAPLEPAKATPLGR